MCCSVLQYAAICCSVLQCAAVLQSVVVCSSLLQCCSVTYTRPVRVVTRLSLTFHVLQVSFVECGMYDISESFPRVNRDFWCCFLAGIGDCILFWYLNSWCVSCTHVRARAHTHTHTNTHKHKHKHTHTHTIAHLHTHTHRAPRRDLGRKAETMRYYGGMRMFSRTPCDNGCHGMPARSVSWLPRVPQPCTRKFETNCGAMGSSARLRNV